jgi:hypothetical protein
MKTGQDTQRDFQIGTPLAKNPASFVRTFRLACGHAGYRNCLRWARAFTYNPKDFKRDGKFGPRHFLRSCRQFAWPEFKSIFKI